MPYLDQSRICVECGKPFVFSAGEQEFYAQRQFNAAPKRCRDCRDSRKRDRDTGSSNAVYRSEGFQTGGIGDFLPSRLGGNGGPRSRSISSSSAHREVDASSASVRGSRPPRAAYDIVCAACGKTSRVPFRPSADKPVYCSDCYQIKKGGP